MAKGIERVFIIVLDSLGIGALPDAAGYGDEGSNTLGAIMRSESFYAPTLQSLGLFNIDGVDGGLKTDKPMASFARVSEKSKGKDTTIGHWEIAGVVSPKPLPTYPNGFPQFIIDEFEKRTGRGVLCNKVYSGTEVIKDYGPEHIKTGGLIVYTSADSVFQIAAHEDVVPIEELYRYCEIARDIMRGEHAVGRIIARPFTGEYPFRRTANRHDFSLTPPRKTMLDYIKEKGMDVIAVGKIKDIFAGQGVTESYPIKNNNDGMEITNSIAEKDFRGLCFVNLVDFDMVFGHRNDIEGYAKAVSEFDLGLAELLSRLRDDDVLIITADHGCDPSTPSTDHSREYVPLLVYGRKIKQGVNLGVRETFADTAATVLEMLGADGKTDGVSYYKEIKYVR
ncbi:MAG TPA: phosphopentomutase [Clostridia bacterium]|jgi:phosphopentomutase|nr:phosphopentomutase [Clostridia bacterium]HOL61108.1 phosphopentomutase [Clostridia bacterium]HPO53758.1 phosphopentomutase [Clostridia bacterium]